MLYIFHLLACDSVMVHNVPELVSPTVHPSMKIPIEEILPVKGPDITTFEVQARYEQFEGTVYSAAHNINLRSEPTVLSDVVTKVPLGQPITIIEISEEAELGGRKDFWYHISTEINGAKHTGYLFASTLTPHRIDGDFDGDGTEETLVISFNNNYSLLFRLHDPNDSNAYSWVNMGEYTQSQGEEQRTAEQALIRIYPAEIAGQVLFRIDVDCPNECFGNALHWVKFASYSQGKLQRALEYEETEFENRFTSVQLDFQRHKKSMLLSKISGIVQPDHSIIQETSMEIWDLYTGVYRLRSTSQTQKAHMPPPMALMETPSQWIATATHTESEIDFSSFSQISSSKSSQTDTSPPTTSKITTKSNTKAETHDPSNEQSSKNVQSAPSTDSIKTDHKTSTTATIQTKHPSSLSGSNIPSDRISVLPVEKKERQEQSNSAPISVPPKLVVSPPQNANSLIRSSAPKEVKKNKSSEPAVIPQNEDPIQDSGENFDPIIQPQKTEE